MRRVATSVKPSGISPARRGVSLVELLITITMGGVVLALGLSTLHLLLRTDRTLIHSLQRRQTVAQLADAFRNDIHAARKVDLIPAENEQNPASLRVQLAADHQVRYTTENQTLIRTETQKQKTLQTARFRFSPGTEISFRSDNRNRMGLVLRSPNPSSNQTRRSEAAGPPRELEIHAVVARDHRFEEKPTP